MTHRVIGVLVGVAVVTAASVWVGAQQSGRSALEGAWVLQDYTTAKPVPGLNKPTGLMLFTGNHYSILFLRDSSPRPEVGPVGEGATADQLRAAWGPLQANAGTFQVSGNTLTTRGIVSKGNPPMAPGNFTERTFMLKGDTLVLTSTRNDDGPSANPVTYRLTRAR